MKKQITIYGAGYVGLVTGVCLAELGNHVLLIDIDPTKIANLTRGILPIFEPDLAENLNRHRKNKRLRFSTDHREGALYGLYQFIAVGTPSAADGSAQLDHVYTVASHIAEHMTEYRLIVNKSTVTLGTSRKIKELIQNKLSERGCSIPFDVAANPEFLRQGAALADFLKPDRIIIGSDSKRAIAYMQKLYRPLDETGQRFIIMDSTSAELTKYCANAYLAARISFMNEMSQIAERFGADIDMIRRGMSADQRIGSHFLYAGCGFGGSCFPKDVRALRHMAEISSCDVPILRAIEQINERQKRILFAKISRYFDAEIAGKRIAVWGLSFKPNTDDMREAPSRTLIDSLLEAQAYVQAYDPAASNIAQKIYGHHPQFSLHQTQEEALTNADVLAVVAEWDQFRHPDFMLLKEKLRYPAIFDGRNIYAPEDLAAHGIRYYGIGRGDNSSIKR